MKDAKIVKKENTGFKAFLIEKKGWVLIVGIFMLIMLFFTAMPMVNIPFVGRVGMVLGLTPKEMGDITLADFAAYAVGVEGNRISAAQGGKYSPYETVGGLSPFSVMSKDRIANSTGDYLKEYQASIGAYGQRADGSYVTGVQQTGAGNEYQGVAITPPGATDTPIIDSNKPADAALGNPIYGSIMQQNASSATKMTLPKPKGGQNIDGKATSQSVFGNALENLKNKFVGGRSGVMGGYNAIANRINTRVGGIGQMGAFGSMGRSYYFSFNAKVAGYKVTAKSLAEAAFDGEAPAEEALITPGEEKEAILNTLEPPSTILNKANARINACNQAKTTYQSGITSNRETFKATLTSLQSIGSDFKKGVPGSCDKTLGFIGAQTAAKRDAWNKMVDSIVTTCEQLKESEGSYTGACGLDYNPTPTGNCASLKNIRLKGGSFPLFVWKCKNKVKFNNFSCSSKADCKAKIEKLFSEVSNSEVTGANENF